MSGIKQKLKEKWTERKNKNDKEKEIIDVVDFFNRNISNIFKVIDTCDTNISNNPDIDWVRRIIKIVRYESPSLMLERCTDKLWDNREYIMTRNEAFILDNKNTSKYIKDDEKKEWLERLVKFIGSKYKVLPPESLEILWGCINNMLEASIKYKLLMNDHS